MIYYWQGVTTTVDNKALIIDIIIVFFPIKFEKYIFFFKTFLSINLSLHNLVNFIFHIILQYCTIALHNV